MPADLAKAVKDYDQAQSKCDRAELERLLADTCELCGSHDDVEVHHLRALKDLQQQGRAEKPKWVKLMAARGW